MRYIDRTDLALPDEWAVRARSKAAAIAAAKAEDEAASVASLLDSARAVWTDAKPALEELSARKCWYCEMLQVRSDLNVDHFRPKSRVAEDAHHPGYWWLAIAPENLRLSCQFCNQRRRGVDGAPGGGKWDHFPIRDESRRARSPKDDIAREEVVLLDPAQAVDVSLLSFDYDGKAFPNPQKCAPSTFELERAEKSIELYHLNHRGIVDERKKLNRLLGRFFDIAVRCLEATDGDPQHTENLADAVNALRGAISERAVLSASARAYLRSRRADSAIASTLVAELLEY